MGVPGKGTAVMLSRDEFQISRRNLLGVASSLAALPLVTSTQSFASPANSTTSIVGGRGIASNTAKWRVGSLEVSSIGLGVQNMSRTYQTTVPSRPELIHIFRSSSTTGLRFSMQPRLWASRGRANSGQGAASI